MYNLVRSTEKLPAGLREQHEHDRVVVPDRHRDGETDGAPDLAGYICPARHPVPSGLARYCVVRKISRIRDEMKKAAEGSSS